MERNHFRRQHQHDPRNNPQVQELERPKEPQGTQVIFIRNCKDHDGALLAIGNECHKLRSQ